MAPNLVTVDLSVHPPYTAERARDLAYHLLKTAQALMAVTVPATGALAGDTANLELVADHLAAGTATLVNIMSNLRANLELDEGAPGAIRAAADATSSARLLRDDVDAVRVALSAPAGQDAA